MMNLEFIYLFSIRQRPATSPFLKVISIHGAARDSLSVKGNFFDDDCARRFVSLMRHDVRT